MNVFGHWAKKFQNLILLCSAGPSKKQPMCPEVLFDKEKVFQRKVLFYKCFRILIRNVCTFKKIVVLVPKTLLYVSWGTLSEKFLYQKISFFWKNLSDFERKVFGLLAKLFPARLSSFHSTFAEEGFRENFLGKKVFFNASRLEAKNCLLKRNQIEREIFILRVRRNFLRKNILFKVIWYIFSGISSKKL